MVEDTFLDKGITKEADSQYACGSGSPLNHFSSGGACEESPWGATCQNGVESKKNAMWSYVKSTAISGEAAMMAAVAAGHGTYVSFIVYYNFMEYSSGVYSTIQCCDFSEPPVCNECSKEGGHAVALVGYGVDSGKKYWLLQNSWGASWGENGYVRFLRGVDLCSIETRGPQSFEATVSGAPQAPTPAPLPSPEPASPASPGAPTPPPAPLEPHAPQPWDPWASTPAPSTGTDEDDDNKKDAPKDGKTNAHGIGLPGATLMLVACIGFLSSL